MKQLALTTFLHGRQRFAAGVVYDVPEALAAYAGALGWLGPPPDGSAPAHPVAPELLGEIPPPPPAAAKGAAPPTLDVQSGRHLAVDRLGVADSLGRPAGAAVAGAQES